MNSIKPSARELVVAHSCLLLSQSIIPPGVNPHELENTSVGTNFRSCSSKCPCLNRLRDMKTMGWMALMYKSPRVWLRAAAGKAIDHSRQSPSASSRGRRQISPSQGSATGAPRRETACSGLAQSASPALARSWRARKQQLFLEGLTTVTVLSGGRPPGASRRRGGRQAILRLRSQRSDADRSGISR